MVTRWRMARVVCRVVRTTGRGPTLLASDRNKDTPSWLPRGTPPYGILLQVHGVLNACNLLCKSHVAETGVLSFAYVTAVVCVKLGSLVRTKIPWLKRVRSDRLCHMPSALLAGRMDKRGQNGQHAEGSTPAQEGVILEAGRCVG